MEKLEPTFKLNGWDPDLLTKFGLGSSRRKVFTAYGVIRDRPTGLAIEVKAIIESRLGRMAPDAFQRGDAGLEHVKKAHGADARDCSGRAASEALAIYG
jgi:hypothetical protein